MFLIYEYLTNKELKNYFKGNHTNFLQIYFANDQFLLSCIPAVGLVAHRKRYVSRPISS